jgi:hypothetical protein
MRYPGHALVRFDFIIFLVSERFQDIRGTVRVFEINQS